MAYATSVYPDERSSPIRVYSVCQSTKYFKKQLHEKDILHQKSLK